MIKNIMLSTVGAMFLLGVPGAMADDTICPPSLGAETVDNVIVSPDMPGICDLDGTTVKGNVKVEEDGRFRATGAYIAGDVQA